MKRTLYVGIAVASFAIPAHAAGGGGAAPVPPATGGAGHAAAPSANVTTDFVMTPPSTGCGQPSSVSIAATITNKGMAPFSGQIFSNPSAGPPTIFQVPANGQTQQGVKVGFNCAHTPLLQNFKATVADSTGNVIGSKGFKVGSLTYSQLSARPPPAGSVKNVMFFSAFIVEKAACRQPLSVQFEGVNLSDSGLTPSFSATVEYPGAPDKNTTIYGQQRVEKGNFQVRFDGAALDCTFSIPVIKPKASLGSAITMPVQGVVVGTPETHADSVEWVDESAQDPSMGHR